MKKILPWMPAHSRPVPRLNQYNRYDRPNVTSIIRR